jgi:hypothetical protein
LYILLYLCFYFVILICGKDPVQMICDFHQDSVKDFSEGFFHKYVSIQACHNNSSCLSNRKDPFQTPNDLWLLTGFFWVSFQCFLMPQDRLKMEITLMLAFHSTLGFESFFWTYLLVLVSVLSYIVCFISRPCWKMAIKT